VLMTVVATVSCMTRYPVKSLQGEPLDTGELRWGGIHGDRRFAFRDLDTGRIASAKQPRPWRALLDLAASTDDSGVVVHMPTSYASTWPEVEGVTLVGQREFPMALGTDAVRFVDVAGLHVMTTATLQQLEETGTGSTADPHRFRPNLVLDTGHVPPSFREDAWVGQVLQVGDTARIRLTTKAPRCVMTTVEQPGLAHDAGILRAAATNRYRFEGIGTLACAGAYAEVVEPGPVRVGDPVVLLRPAGRL
jgi:uncharacterized protein